MEINRNALSMPSGLEVESASFHVPVSDVSSPSVMTGSSDWKSRLNEKVGSLRQQLSSKVDEVKPVVQQRVSAVRDGVSTRMSSLRSSVAMKSSDVQTDMRTNPMKWAGIAAGTGVGLGLIGRIMHHRKYHSRRSAVPQLIIVEAC